MMILTLQKYQYMICKIYGHKLAETGIVTIMYIYDKYTVVDNLCFWHQNQLLFYVSKNAKRIISKMLDFNELTVEDDLPRM
jgi:uncharacterized membrane protein required for colicin V production